MKRKMDLNKLIASYESKAKKERAEISYLKGRIATFMDSDPDSPYLKKLKWDLKNARFILRARLHIIRAAIKCMDMGLFKEQESKELTVA